MPNTYEIPLTATPQTFNITLQKVVYSLTVYWNAQNADGTWMLDIADENGNAIIDGIPLITGADLLAQYQHLGFGGVLVVQSDYNADALPTIDNLGSNSHLFFVTP